MKILAVNYLLNSKSMCTKQHFNLILILNCETGTWFRSVPFTGNWNRFLCIQENRGKCIFPWSPVQTIGTLSVFDQGHIYVDDNEKSVGHPRSVVTLPSKYTFFPPSQHPLLCSCLHWYWLHYWFFTPILCVCTELCKCVSKIQHIKRMNTKFLNFTT